MNAATQATPVVKEVTINAPVEKVWKAITDKNQMKEWYFDIEDFKPEVGARFQFTGGKPDGRQFTHLCEILEVIPNKKLKHSWRYEGFEGNSFVTWELFAEGSKTKVKLTHEGLETFPAIQDFAKENFVGGWNQIVGTSLPNYVESGN